jgi:hypothetical protein
MAVFNTGRNFLAQVNGLHRQYLVEAQRFRFVEQGGKGKSMGGGFEKVDSWQLTVV